MGEVCDDSGNEIRAVVPSCPGARRPVGPSCSVPAPPACWPAARPARRARPAPPRRPGRSPASGPGTPVRGGSLTVGTIAEIDGFYPPTNHWDTNGFLYANAVYDPLMAVAADGTIQPYLAKSMTANSTFDTWTMTLRPGIKFNDGIGPRPRRWSRPTSTPSRPRR